MRRRRQIRRQLAQKQPQPQQNFSIIKKRKLAAKAGFLVKSLAAKLLDPQVIRDQKRWNSAFDAYVETTIAIGALRHFNSLISELRGLKNLDVLRSTEHPKRIEIALEHLEKLQPFVQQVALAEGLTEPRKRFAAKLNAIHGLNSEMQMADPEMRKFLEILLLRAQKI
ncbi:MAG: hypothetical protein QW400_02365 [Candidatus Diapherotrites archaeon]